MTDNTESTTILHTVLKPPADRSVAIAEAVKELNWRKASKAPGTNLTLTAAVPDTAANRVAVMATALGQAMADAISLALLLGGNGPAEFQSLQQQALALAATECFRIMDVDAAPVLRQKWGEHWQAEWQRQQQTRDA